MLIFLSFYRIGNTKFWHDESEVGMIGKQILRTGLPLAEDSDGILPVALTNDFHTPWQPHLYRWQTWLMFYVAAAGMGVGGATEIAARFPFVCIGLLNLIFIYYLVKELIGDIRLAKVTTLLLGFSAQYLILIRNARYYSLIMCLGTLSVFFFLQCMRSYLQDSVKKNKIVRSELGFLISMVALFYTHYLSFYGFFIAFVALYLALLLWKRKLQISFSSLVWLGKRSFTWTIIGIVGFTTPWLMLFRKGISGGGYFSMLEAIQNVVTLATKLNRTIPLILVAGGLYVLFLRLSKEKRYAFQRFCVITILMLVMTSIFLVSLMVALHLPPSFAPEFRYVLAIYPLLFIFLGAALLKIYDNSKVIGIIFFAMVMLSNAFSLPLEVSLPESYWPLPQSRFSVRSYLFEYISKELKDGYAGPVDNITAFLSKREHSQQKVFSSLEGLALKFSLNNTKVDNAYTFSLRMNRPMVARDLLEYDWVIFRNACAIECSGLNETDVTQVLEKNFIAFELNSFDYIVNNREEVPYHFFSSPVHPPHVVVYGRKNSFDTKNE